MAAFFFYIFYSFCFIDFYRCFYRWLVWNLQANISERIRNKYDDDWDTDLSVAA